MKYDQKSFEEILRRSYHEPKINRIIDQTVAFYLDQKLSLKEVDGIMQVVYAKLQAEGMYND